MYDICVDHGHTERTMTDGSPLPFLLTNAPHIFTCQRTEHDIRNNTCFTCFGITENDTPCETCSIDKTLIKTWCNPRGRCCQHPETLLTNQQAPYAYIIHSWNAAKRNPSKLHYGIDFTGSVYDGYLDSLLVSLLLQMHNMRVFQPFKDEERHPFDLAFWKQCFSGIDSVLQELSGSMRFPDTLSVLTKTTYTLHGVNDKSIHYYGNTLWNSHLFQKLFSNYDNIKNKFLGLFAMDRSIPGQDRSIPRSDSAYDRIGSLLSPQQAQQQPQQQSIVLQSNTSPPQTNAISPVDLMKTFEGIPSPGSLFNFATTPEHTTRKHYVKNIYSNMNIHTSNDIICMLVEQKTHCFKSHKIQKLFDSYNFQSETLNLRMFNMLMAAVTPEDVTDMNAIYDHIGNYMLVQK